MSDENDVTGLLSLAGTGDTKAADRLFPLIYDELRGIAVGAMGDERPDHTLQATALVHEAYLKLVDQTRTKWRDKAHFLSVAAMAIRRILVDHARTKGRTKRGGDRARLELDEALVSSFEKSVDVIALEEALTRLAQENQRQARLVEMRFFSGLTVGEAASVLGISITSAERDWRYARAVLYRDLVDGLSSDAGN